MNVVVLLASKSVCEAVGRCVRIHSTCSNLAGVDLAPFLNAPLINMADGRELYFL
jgi:hypothetical protein